ncbi:alpha/beta fold hydrolase [Microbulbifer epialgicus]|uniref:Alpha/beta fold hydrolase n=1 Tax=Microbulbifer epialgicus TaxID=393907 RepID=A0ABV4P087_9GAMM
MAVFSCDGVELNYELRGSGPRLVFHPGTLSDLRVHPTIFDSPLSDAFEILSFDPRGIGQSNSPDDSPTMSDYAHDLKRLMTYIGWQDALIVGVSFGGMVVQEFALQYPQSVQKLVLVVSSSGGQGGSSFPLHEYDIEGMTADEKVAFLISAGDRRLPSVTCKNTDPELYLPIYKYYRQVSEIAANKPKGSLCRTRQLQARKGHDTFERLPGLNKQTLICGGRYDNIAPFQNQVALYQQIPNARLGIFDGGHNVLWQDALIWNFILAFLRLS